MTDTAFDRPPGDPSMPAEAKGGNRPVCSSTRSDCCSLWASRRTSFWVANTGLLWGPGVPLGLVVARRRPDGHPPGLLPAHHDRTGQHQHVLALAFGILTVLLVVVGSLWIMADLNDNDDARRQS